MKGDKSDNKIVNEFMQEELSLPKIIFGTSCLGNLYQDVPYARKLALIDQAVKSDLLPVVFDSAGKYGAGLALESLGTCLQELGVDSKSIIISNKLGWVRSPLITKEPTFEPGVWKNLKYDAVQKINYDGILECYEQGNLLLGRYHPQLVSVHDPDEYLDASKNEQDKKNRLNDIFEAYRALADLKKEGRVSHIGIGAKNWKTIELISSYIQLDWVMLANSLTIYHHPPDLLSFVNRLHKKGITIINSAVFHGGFLIGSDYFDYKFINAGSVENRSLLAWRQLFFDKCSRFNISPSAACIAFALNIPGVSSIALSSSSTERMKKNMEDIRVEIPSDFWKQIKLHGLIAKEFPYL